MQIKENSPEKELLNSWRNVDNAEYYESIPIATFKKYAVLGGFQSGCDIDMFFEFIKNANSVLEIGAGYGRVLENLIVRGYTGNLYAIERSKKLFTYLQENFHDRVNLINADISHFQPDSKFDAILWMWSSISDFSQNEQIPILQRLLNWLTKDGLLILDTISHKIKLADEFTQQDKSYVENAEHGVVYGYIPSIDDMKNYAKILNVSSQHLPYKTATDRPRVIHIFQKK